MVRDTNIVIGHQEALSAYDLKTGEQTWTARPPESGATPCAMSGTVTGDGMGAVLFRKAGASSLAPCTLLAVVDTATGKVKWAQDVAPGADGGEQAGLAVDEKSKSVYAVTANRVFSYGLEDGKKRWAVGDAESCRLSGDASPTAVVVFQSCYGTDDTRIASLNLKDGSKSKWSYPVDGGASARVTVLSAEPAVALINPGTASARGNIVAFDDEGRPVKEIPQSQSYGKLPSERLIDSYPGYLVKGTTMVASVRSGASDKVTAIAAFDLSTGEEKWHTSESGRAVQPVGFDGDSVLAFEDGASYSDQRRFIRYSLDSGEPARGGAFPGDLGSAFRFNRILVRGDLVLMVEHYASGYYPRLTAFGPTG